MIISRRVTIVRVSRPTEGDKDINKKLQWFGDSLGLFNLRDKDKSCFRVFIELLKAAKLRQPLSSDEIALKLGLTRGTVVHHLDKLMGSGIVVTQRNRYMLRVDNLRDLVEEIRHDVNKTCDGLAEVADQIDHALGI